MGRKLVLILVFLMLLVSLVYPRFQSSEVRASDGYPVHNLNTGLNYTSIQGAIDAPETLNGHTIFVDKGTYYENIKVNKTVSLIGENRESTVIDGNLTGNVMNITANNVNVSSFTVQESGSNSLNCGIYVDQWSTGNNISYNIISNNSYGIYLHDSRENLVSNNTALNNSAGILLYNSSQNTVYGNTALNNLVGILLLYSSNNTLFDNNMTGNAYNFGVNGNSDSQFYNSIYVNNTVDGKAVYYLKDMSDAFYDAHTNAGTFYLINCKNITIQDIVLKSNFMGVLFWNTNCSRIENVTTFNNRGDGITLWSCSNDTISGNNASSNGNDGIAVDYSSNNIISRNIAFNNVGNGISLPDFGNNVVSGNNIYSNNNAGIMVGTSSSSSNNNTFSGNDVSGNDWGIKIWSSENNVFFDNNILTNNWVGIDLHESSNNTFFGNNVYSNHQLGIYLYSSTNNLVFHNNFVNNSGSEFMGFDNFFDNGVEGNHWSDYIVADNNYDGIGDSPYFLSASHLSRDNYPLMGTFLDFNATSENHVQIICNSTISDFQFNGTTMSFNVSGENDTAGFCRICIPTELMNKPFKVFVNSTDVPYNLLLCSNSTNSYLYFNYTHSTQGVMIIPEFPSFLIPPLFMTIMLPAIIVYRRKHLT